MSTSAHAGIISLEMVVAVTAAILIGTLIVTAVGFAGPEVVHNAAHDLRHSLAFPCH
ncbi:MAG: CbtB-domain containing protein [Gammaproteobacteria bacterium]|nr:CbtB-domain containing protein [Gammaproteobacteria bacterium]